jgi:hypothetical protein
MSKVWVRPRICQKTPLMLYVPLTLPSTPTSQKAADDN